MSNMKNLSRDNTIYGAKKDNITDKKSPYKYLTRWFKNATADAHLAGEIKYGDWNFLRGHTVMQLLEAMERHIEAVKSGEDYDADCSERIGRFVHHLGCAAAGINMYLAQLELGTLVDDRPWNDIKEGKQNGTDNTSHTDISRPTFSLGDSGTDSCASGRRI